MDSILDWIRREGIIFRGGSGSGVNLSRLRSSKEQLSKGGYASGPVSFMRGADASAGTIKSGGKTRRAAKMVVLDVDHPDILEFVWCKAREEEKARVLEQAGYDMSLDSPDWSSIQYQNANNSVRVSDAFMEAVEDDADWNLTARVDGSVVETMKARELLRQIAEAAWRCADPGVQYDTTINSWHTLPNSGRINASNPCSEYMSIDDSACNLASLNLMKFRREDGELDVEAFEHAVDVVFLAQEILVGNSSYPTPEIERQREGLPPARARLREPRRAADGARPSVRLGRGPRLRGRDHRADDRPRLPQVRRDRGPDGPVRRLPAERRGDDRRDREAPRGGRQHRGTETVPSDLLGAARKAWDDALNIGEVHGYRNAQATVLAPTGTISFMMDCDTTGVEPDFSLVKSKKLVGGGEITIVNKTVPLGLEKLGYAPAEVDEIVAFIDERNTIVGAPFVKDGALPGLRLRDRRAGRPLRRPREDDGRDPAVHLGRDLEDGQPARDRDDRRRRGRLPRRLEARREGDRDLPRQLQGRPAALGQVRRRPGRACASGGPVGTLAAPRRRRLPDDRTEVGRKFRVGEYEGYIHVGLFDDGTPGDIFLDIAKEGTTLAGLMNSFMIAVSLGLQYGVPLEVYVSKFSHMRFEPSGPTNDPDIRTAKSIVDYVFRWMGKKFLTRRPAGGDRHPLARRCAPAWRRPTQPERRRCRARGSGAAGRPRSSTRTRTRSSARAAAGGWCARAPATPAATAAPRPAAAEPKRGSGP